MLHNQFSEGISQCLLVSTMFPWCPGTSYKQYPWHWEERRLLPALDQLLTFSYRQCHYASLLPWGSPLTQAQGFPICLLHFAHHVVPVLHFWRLSPKFTSTKILVCLLCSQFAFLRHSFSDDEQNSFSKKKSLNTFQDFFPFLCFLFCFVICFLNYVHKSEIFHLSIHRGFKLLYLEILCALTFYCLFIF